jgi:hypothetical protein
MKVGATCSSAQKAAGPSKEWKGSSGSHGSPSEPNNSPSDSPSISRCFSIEERVEASRLWVWWIETVVVGMGSVASSTIGSGRATSRWCISKVLMEENCWCEGGWCTISLKLGLVHAKSHGKGSGTRRGAGVLPKP